MFHVQPIWRKNSKNIFRAIYSLGHYLLGLSNPTFPLKAILRGFFPPEIESSLEKSYQRLIDILDGKFEFKAGEEYLRGINKNIYELSNTMKRFGTDLAGVIKEGLQEGSPPSRPTPSANKIPNASRSAVSAAKNHRSSLSILDMFFPSLFVWNTESGKAD